jgi:alpha-ribazole phosphatase
LNPVLWKWSEQVRRIYLIRHGQTAWNAEGRWQGTMDVPLGATGHEQARQLAVSLQDRSITAIYSSDLTRARTTAEPLAQIKHLPIHQEARLQEINFGVFQGMTHEEIRQKYPVEERALFTNYMDSAAPEGESRRQMQARVFSVWQEILANEAGPEIVIVTHGGPVRLLLMKLFPEQMERLMKVPIPNTSVTTILEERHKLQLHSLSTSTHLNSVNQQDAP